MTEILFRKKVGVLIFLVGTIGFFASTILLDQSETTIQYLNVQYMLRMAIPYLIALLALYFGLYFYSGKRLANQITLTLATLLVIAYFIGRTLHT